MFIQVQEMDEIAEIHELYTFELGVFYITHALGKFLFQLVSLERTAKVLKFDPMYMMVEWKTIIEWKRCIYILCPIQFSKLKVNFLSHRLSSWKLANMFFSFIFSLLREKDCCVVPFELAVSVHTTLPETNMCTVTRCIVGTKCNQYISEY